MSKTYVFEGNTTNAAIEKGLKELKVSKDKVDIRVLDENKKSFFSILTPRIVKVEFTLKEDKHQVERPVRKVSKEDMEKQINLIKKFLDEFIPQLPTKNISYTIEPKDDTTIYIELKGEEINYLVGYRAETLNAIQNILSAISRKEITNSARVIVNIDGYREKREIVLKELAEKLEKTVVRTRKSITLEPMSSYERKIIHSKLQDSSKVKTYSIGNEPHRRLVIALK